MKKGLLLVAVLLLTACGSGGVASPVGGSTNNSGSVAKADVTIVINHAPAAATVA